MIATAKWMSTGRLLWCHLQHRHLGTAYCRRSLDTASLRRNEAMCFQAVCYVSIGMSENRKLSKKGISGDTCTLDVTNAVLSRPVQNQPCAPEVIMREHQNDCLQGAFTVQYQVFSSGTLGLSDKVLPRAGLGRPEQSTPARTNIPSCCHVNVERHNSTSNCRRLPRHIPVH
jgi:hypothetical protein